MDKKEARKILAFMHANPMAVISTVGNDMGVPQSALIAFVELPNFEVVFETFYKTRKYENLKANRSVSLVIGWDIKKQITLQYEGRASPIPKKEYEKAITTFLKKDTPCKEQFLRHPHVRLYKIKPLWLRYSDYTGEVPQILEHTF